MGHARSRKTRCCGRATIVAQRVAVSDKRILAKFVLILYADSNLYAGSNFVCGLYAICGDKGTW